MNISNPKKSINKAFMKISPEEGEFNLFKHNITDLYKSLCETEENKESEEHQKNIISDFLKKPFSSYSVNTSGRVDLAISEKGQDTPNRLLFEVKRSTNRSEMLTPDSINCKAMHELLYYYLQERMHNLHLNHLIITNGFDWYIFEARVFESLFYSNKKLVSDFTDFSNKSLSGDTTDFFYKEIAYPAIEEVKEKLACSFFSLDSYFEGRSSTNPHLKNGDASFKEQIALYKLLSPTHLLKLTFSNDSNTLDKDFYQELLHIMGLVEENISGKKLIHRLSPEDRESGSLLENTIEKIEDKDYYISHSHKERFGKNRDERIFSMALGLVITWTNRILFMKLLEGQLKSCRQDGEQLSFLNHEDLQNYDQVASLFFAILGKPIEQRRERFRPIFDTIPYLNSSLFEQSKLEKELFDISGLEDSIQMKLYKVSVLKDEQGKRISGKLPGLEYLLKFLDSYNFGSDSTTRLQKKQKTIINASVLGLVFEKINGYKDGSFYTPSFITMYLCRETIRKRVIGKFSEVHNKNYNSMEDIFNQTSFDSESLVDANNILNSLKICDPAVGSGHFLVTALNELIVIKSELGILCDYDGKRLKGYTIEAVNDELIVSDEEGDLFFYQTHKPESLRIQRTLFEEKRRIIESSLFGVDINNNSVKICRLRLWIELLKSTYYKDESLIDLEILPNIDINIKQGNSLVSKYDLDESIKKPLKANGWDIEHYQNMIYVYQNAADKETKYSAMEMIETLKNAVKVDMSQSTRITRDLFSSKGSLTKLTKQDELFEISKKEKKIREKEEKRLKVRIENLEKKFKEIEEGQLYMDSFEWRFEFPEVLDSEGNFIGFDVIIGNPPYIQLQSMNGALEPLKDKFSTYEKTGDIYSLFYELGSMLLRPHGVLGYITSNKWMRANYGKSLRSFFTSKVHPLLVINLGKNVFDEATVESNLLIFEKYQKTGETSEIPALDLSPKNWMNQAIIDEIIDCSINPNKDDPWSIMNSIEKAIKIKVEKKGTPLKKWEVEINSGIKTGFNDAFVISLEKRDELINVDPTNAKIIKPLLRGKDIQKYHSVPPDLFLINSHNGVKQKGLTSVDIKQYPEIKDHLDKFYPSLKKRQDQGVTPYNLRNCAYIEEFEKEKLLWIELVDNGRFTYDNSGIYALNTTYILTGMKIKYLTGVLNSKLITFYFNLICNKSGVGTNRWLNMYVELIPVLQPNDNQEKQITDIVDKILIAKYEKKDTSQFVNDIDQIVFGLYDLTEEEINFVKGI